VEEVSEGVEFAVEITVPASARPANMDSRPIIIRLTEDDAGGKKRTGQSPLGRLVSTVPSDWGSGPVGIAALE
jgi:hypothetical protein